VAHLPRPPAVAQALLRVLPPADRDQVIADMDELFRARVETRGERAARRWYTVHAVRLLIVFRWEGLRSSRNLKRRQTSANRRGIVMDEIERGVRRLWARPGASIVSILSLACGISVASATWAMLSAIVLHPLPVQSPERLVAVGSQSLSGGAPRGRVSTGVTYLPYRAIREAGVFEELAAGGPWTAMVETSGYAESREIQFASHDYLSALGVRMSLGRWFRADEDQRGAPLVAVSSYRFWQVSLAADQNVVGRTLVVAGQPVTVIGVVAARFRGTRLDRAPDMYMPLETVARVGHPSMINYYQDLSQAKSPTAWIEIVGRLHAGLDAAETAQRLNAAIGALTTPLPRFYSVMDVESAAVPEAVRPRMVQFAKLLGGTVGLLLLIGCSTVGLLLLIRTEARRDEFALCLALGATRSRLAWSIAIEGGLLAAGGVLLSIPIAEGLIGSLRAFELPGRVSIDLLEVSAMPTTFAAAGVAGAAATLFMAMIAGGFAFSCRATDGLRSRVGATPCLTRRRSRRVLVAAQVAVALVLVSGATLLVRSLTHALSLNPAIPTHQIVTGFVSPTSYGYSPGRVGEYFDEIRRRLSANPAISAVSYTAFEGSGPGRNRVVDGFPLDIPDTVTNTLVSDGYFETLGLQATRGRVLQPGDHHSVELVGVVSASLARHLAPHGDVVGRRYAERRNNGTQTEAIRIVGVVPDVIVNPARLEPSVMYRPFLPGGATRGSLRIVVRANERSDAAIAAITDTMRAVDSAVRPGPLTTMNEEIASQMEPQQFGALVMGVLGTVAVLLTLLGAYVLAESMAVARQKEMSIRAALGASSAQLGRLVLGETTRLVGAGVIVGLGLAWLGAGTIRSFLFQIEPLDVPTLAGASAMLLILALGVSLRPALAAARVDLARTLRDT